MAKVEPERWIALQVNWFRAEPSGKAGFSAQKVILDSDSVPFASRDEAIAAAKREVGLTFVVARIATTVRAEVQHVYHIEGE